MNKKTVWPISCPWFLLIIDHNKPGNEMRQNHFLFKNSSTKSKHNFCFVKIELNESVYFLKDVNLNKSSINRSTLYINHTREQRWRKLSFKTLTLNSSDEPGRMNTKFSNLTTQTIQSDRILQKSLSTTHSWQGIILLTQENTTLQTQGLNKIH